MYLCIYCGSPLVPDKAEATLPAVCYGSPLDPAKAEATLPGSSKIIKAVIQYE